MTTLPHELYRAEQVRELDRRAIQDHGVAGIELMERAGAAAFAFMRRRWPRARRLGVLCGAGNNGGDGYIIARLAHGAGLAVSLTAVTDPDKLAGDAATAAQLAFEAGLTARPWAGGLDADCDLYVDAMLGTGLRGEVRGRFAEAIAALNRLQRPVLAVDLPSGLEADTGVALGEAVRAEATATFIGMKRGMLTGQGPALCGQVVFDDLAVPAGVYEGVRAQVRRFGWSQWRQRFHPRAADAHKGDFGHVLVVGGNRGMIGAVRMAGEAAQRCGAGLVSVATRPGHAAAVLAGRPELMVHEVDGGAALKPLLRRADVVAVGPGLGQDAWARGLLGPILDADAPLVVDADALNLLAAEPERRPQWVLTPHPGEAGRLLGSDAGAVQRDRFAAVAALQARFGGVALLKGAGTLIHDGGESTWLVDAGNPGMASGGMGDVLTGVIAGLCAQGLPPSEAARAGAALHGAAADAAAAQFGQRGLLATDLLRPLQRLVNPDPARL